MSMLHSFYCWGTVLVILFSTLFMNIFGKDSWPVLSLVGCGLCGLSVGILWPGIFSIANHRIPKGGTALFALMALAGDVGCTSGPTLVGLIAGQFDNNLKAGLTAVLIFPILLIICAILYRKGQLYRKINF